MSNKNLYSSSQCDGLTSASGACFEAAPSEIWIRLASVSVGGAYSRVACIRTCLSSVSCASACVAKTWAVVDSVDFQKVIVTGLGHFAHAGGESFEASFRHHGRLPIFRKGVLVVVHDAGEVVGCPVERAVARTYDFELVSIAIFDVCGAYFDVLVPVVARLLVVEAHSVQQFVHHRVEGHAGAAGIILQRKHLPAADGANRRVASISGGEDVNIIRLRCSLNKPNARTLGYALHGL